MPTYEADEQFVRDWRGLKPAQRQRFRVAVRRFVSDVKAKRTPRPSFDIERFKGHNGVFEFHWAPNGRALFSY